MVMPGRKERGRSLPAEKGEQQSPPPRLPVLHLVVCTVADTRHHRDHVVLDSVVH